MKRFLVGAGWFAVLWLGVSMLGGMVFGAMASAGTTDVAEGARLGAQAGAQFGAQYGGLVILGSLAVAVIGTLAGWLPGTRPSDS